MKKMISKILVISILFTPYIYATAVEHNQIIYDTVISPNTGRIWLDRNLGASQVCTALNDENCYGDYYQWGRNTDGHEKSNSSTTSNQTTNIDNTGHGNFISGNPDWTSIDSDGSQRNENWYTLDGTSVCPTGYRVPTIEELSAETIDVGTSNNVDVYNSFLKLASSGRRSKHGIMVEKGISNYIWSSTPYDTKTSDINFNSDYIGIANNNRAGGYSVRCIQDESTTINHVPIANPQIVYTNTNVDVNIKLTGYDNDGDKLTYTLEIFPLNGTIKGTAPNLIYTPNNYYNGTDSFSFKINDGTVDSETKTVNINILDAFYSGDTHNGIIYDTVISPNTGRIWLDRNLGASQVCTALNDENCYGDYYQWGRNTDGHEKSNSSTTSNQTTNIDNTGHGNFISGNPDWTSIDSDGSQRNENWYTLDGTSVCPTGYRVPTIEELSAETIDVGTSNNVDVYNSFLKLASSGRRSKHGIMVEKGISNYIWSSTPYDTKTSDINFNSDYIGIANNNRAGGYSVRCIQDESTTINHVPIAIAGDDKNITEYESFTLDASASTDDGTIVSYSWSENGIELNNQATFTTSDFSLGTHNITLSVTDDQGVVGSDTVTIRVEINNAPTASNIIITGTPNLEEVLTLNYDYSDQDGDNEGDSIIVWETEYKELQRSTDRTFTVPEGYDGDVVRASVYPVDNKGLKSLIKYDSSNKQRLIYGDIFFVNSTNGNDSNDGRSEDQAWKTIEHIMNAIRDGEVPDGSNILFKRGETFIDKYFAITLTGDKNKYNPVVIGAYGDNTKPKPVFSGAAYLFWNKNLAEHIKIQDINISNQTVGTSLSFARKNIKDVTISRVDIDNSKTNGIYLKSIDSYIIENCTITNSGLGGIVIFGNKENEVLDNWIKITNGVIRNNIIKTTHPTNGDGITLHRSSANSYGISDINNIGSNHLIENNTVSGCGENAFDITAGNNIIIKNNKSYDTRQGNIAIGHGAENVLIDSNYIYNSLSGVAISQPTKDVLIKNNIIESSTTRSISFSASHEGEGVFSVDTKIYNNTIIHTSNYEVFRLSKEIKNVEFKNNILHRASAERAYYFYNTTPSDINATFSNNLISRQSNDVNDHFAVLYFKDGTTIKYTFSQWQDNINQGLHSLLGNPDWVDDTNKNYQLKDTSVAINNGTDLDLIKDYSGANRDDGNLDIGAFEYSSD